MSQSLAIKGGTPLRGAPFTSWPIHDGRERELMLAVLESGVWSFGGPREAEFAQRFAEFCGAARAHCVANGSVSLEIALRALGVGPGDEVIVPALTWNATAWAVVQLGAYPVFADIREADWCIDPEDVKRKITPRTKAIIPVHLYNQIAEMDALLEIARTHSLVVLEDCAHAHGSQWNGKGVGALGHAGSFSFQQSKSITSGEGGALVTNDVQVADRIYGLKNCGRPPQAGMPGTFGGNYRITEFQAAVLLAQLERLPAQVETKAANVAALRAKMAKVPGITMTPPKAQATRQGMYAVSMTFDPAAFANVPREILVLALQAEGIPVTTPYDAVYCSALWVNGPKSQNWGSGADVKRRLGLDARCPVAENISRNTGLTMLHHLFLGAESDMDDIAAAFAKVQANASELRGMALEKRLRSVAGAVMRKVGIK